MKTVLDRFLEYVTHNTKAEEEAERFPSTDSQLVFGDFLLRECKEIGLTNIKKDEHGYVTALLPKNAEGFKKVGFLAHMDTSPEASGENVKPVVTTNYNGDPINLSGISITKEEFKDLENYIGQTIITADGNTLLGADDKAGIAEILTAMEYLINHPEIKHGDIAIGFTPDEEVGRGVDYFNVEDFGCDFAYTIDGGRIGELEYENFNAARAKINIQGVSVHPGTAFEVMKNASLIGIELANMLPKNETPAHTKGYDGFYHLVSFKGSTSECSMQYIIRDFTKEGFNNRKEKIAEIVNKLNLVYGDVINLDLYDEYYNMLEKIQPVMEIVDIAKKAMVNCNIEPQITPIRGGTDGARLSYMGLPCPNIFTGGHNFHGIYEFIPKESMEKAVEVIVEICKSV
ncbi:MAG: peptidase T [Anaerotignaceae bacterium]